jgi:hypothetical protein
LVANAESFSEFFDCYKNIIEVSVAPHGRADAVKPLPPSAAQSDYLRATRFAPDEGDEGGFGPLPT